MNAGQRGVATRGRYFDAQARVCRDGASDHLLSFTAAHRFRFTGDHRLVHAGAAVDNCAVGRHGSAGPHDHDIADLKIRRGDLHHFVAVDLLGLVGQKCGERIQGRGGLGEGAHLDPVPKQHDDHQQRQFPPEIQPTVQQVQARTPRGDEGDRDRERDQQHHAGFAGADLGDSTRQERATSPEVNDRAQKRRDPPDPFRVRQLVADEMGESAVEPDDRDRENQHDPEERAELGYVIAVACVARVVVTTVSCMGLVSVMLMMAGVPTGSGAGVGVPVVHGSVLSLQFIVVIGSAAPGG